MADLRERQLELARQAIVDACAQLVTERRHLDFAMKDVAERAGVSLRTVYNHFPAREDLLDALGRDFDRQMAERGGPEAADLSARDDLGGAVRKNFALFEELNGVSEAFAQMPLAEIGRNADRQERTRLIVDHLVAQMPSVPHEEAQAIAVMLRHLLSHRSWFWLTREYGLTTDEAGDVVTWAMSTLIDAAERGVGPKRMEQP
ncbi:MAG: helix-turn-helix domain-containing protein [Microthrixaceae bacterium]